MVRSEVVPMIVAVLRFAMGVIPSGIVALLIVAAGRGEVRRALLAFGLAPLPFAAGVLLHAVGWGPGPPG